MVLDKMAKKMMELGFTLYEARAYICLLQGYPATRYEISKNSGVPRSAIYDVMRRLENSGAVSVISDDPKKYIPLPPDKFTELLDNRYKQKIDDFKRVVSDMDISLESENLWNINGYQNLLLKAKELISNAREQIYVSSWWQEIVELEDDLKAAAERGIKIVLFSLTRMPDIPALIYSYDLDEVELASALDRKLILVRDMEELVMGEANEKYPRKAAWTQNKAIVMIAANHIVLDVTLFGLRMDLDVSDVVIETHPGELATLGRMLHSRFPDNPAFDPSFTRHSIKQPT